MGGLVIVSVPGARPLPYAKVVGGSAEAPTCIGLAPEEAERVVWATGPLAAGLSQSISTGASAAWDSRMGNWLSTGAEKKDEGAGATPWIFGGLLIAMAFGVASLEKKIGRVG
jgi:hypothetical protein